MIAVRPFRAGDAAACEAVFFRAVREGAAGFYDQVQREDWAPEDSDGPDLGEKLGAQSCWVSEQDGAVTGFMSLTAEGHLDMAFVLPEAMGKGHAARLYDALLAHARAAGLARLTVHASEYSRRFLARRGWMLERVETITRPSGVSFERNYMALEDGVPNGAPNGGAP